MSGKNVTHLRALYLDAAIEPHKMPKYPTNNQKVRGNKQLRKSSPAKKRRLFEIGVQTETTMIAMKEVELFTKLMETNRLVCSLPKLSRKLRSQYFKFWRNRWMCAVAMSLNKKEVKFEEEEEFLEEEDVHDVLVRVKYGDSDCGIKEVSFEEYSDLP